MHEVGTTKVKKGKTVTAVAFFSLPNKSWDEFKLTAKDAHQDSIGSTIFKINMGNSDNTSNGGAQGKNTATSNNNSKQAQADPYNPDTWDLPYKGYSSYNAYCEANNGDPRVQQETAQKQHQWAVDNGLENPDGSYTEKGQQEADAMDEDSDY